MQISATLINLYHVCKRELWLHANGIRMEHTSETVAEGKLIHEHSYPQRAEKFTELEIQGNKIDFYDARNKIIHEIKKSDSVENAHTWQAKYYIWLLEKNGVEGVSALLEYPKLRQTQKVVLEQEDKTYLEKLLPEISDLINSKTCPGKINVRFCRSCSYFDFCYADE